jgi:acyl transferase domain-containing protein
MLDEFRKVAESVTYAPPRISLFGNVDGKEVGGEIAHADYWVRHVLAPVRFADGLAALVASGITELVEIGPKPVLMGLRTDSPGTAGTMWAPSLRKDRGDWATLGKSLAALHTRGVNVDWTTFDAPYRHSRVALPTYPFQRERYWHDRQKVRAPEAEPVETPTTPFRADLVAELRKMSAAAREASLQATLEEEAGRVLGLESISPVRPLRELGLDSIAAVELRDRMANRIGRPLPATLAFDHPTLEAQTRYLLQVCDLLESPAPAPVAPHVEADRLESIAGLTDEQIVSALQSRLEEISGDLA